MQVKNILPIESGKEKKLFRLATKSLVTVFCFYFLYNQFQKEQLSFLNIDWPDYLIFMIFFQLILMLLNWYLEIVRWKISIEQFEEISFKQAASDVLGGLAMNWVLPFTTGDFLARIVGKNDKYKGTSAILFNRGIMLLLTSILGIYGAMSFFDVTWNIYPSIIAAIILLVLVITVPKKYTQMFLSYFSQLQRTILTKILLLSVLRYLVFFVQFFILIRYFDSNLNSTLIIAGVGWIFLVRTAVPSFLGGLGLRETSAVFYFQNHVPDISVILIPVFIMWVLNTALPSAVGSVLIWKLVPHYPQDAKNIQVKV